MAHLHNLKRVRYFQIMTGLRGCYMPDNSYVVRVTSRRELRAVIENEALCQAGDGEPVKGLDQRSISWAARHAMRHGGSILPWGYIPEGKSKYHCNGGQWPRPYSIEISEATKEEWLSDEAAPVSSKTL